MFGIDTGPSGQETTSFNQLTGASNFATGVGEGDVTAGSTFMRNILSGDPTLQAQALAPEISTNQQQTQQLKNQTAQFGPRSGGSTATIANADTSGRANIINLLGSEQGKAASDLLSSGSNLLQTGIEGSATGFNEALQMQKQRASMFDDLFKSIAGIGAGILGAIPAGAGSFADTAGNVLAGATS